MALASAPRFLSYVALSVTPAAGLTTGPPAAADQVPTALVVTPIHAGRVVPADDGKDHIEYDLLVTNVFTAPVRLDSVTVTDPAGKPLLTLGGDQLAAATQSVMDQQPRNPIPASGAAAVEVDVAVPPGTAPDRLGQRVAYTYPTDTPQSSAIGSREVTGPQVSVDRRTPMTILPPLTGDGWASVNGCCMPNRHRSLRVGAGTRIATPEEFAIDWIKADDAGHLATGGGKNVADYPAEGAPVRAVDAGEVVVTHDGMPESVPFQRSPYLHQPADYGGNFVLERIRPDVYAVYAHLQPGSVAVKVGDHVAAGAPIGRLGNSGNSTSPHLHFGLLDGPDFLTADSVPFVFADYRLRAQITGGDIPNLMVAPVGREITDAYPLVYGIADYH